MFTRSSLGSVSRRYSLIIHSITGRRIRSPRQHRADVHRTVDAARDRPNRRARVDGHCDERPFRSYGPNYSTSPMIEYDGIPTPPAAYVIRGDVRDRLADPHSADGLS